VSDERIWTARRPTAESQPSLELASRWPSFADEEYTDGIGIPQPRVIRLTLLRTDPRVVRWSTASTSTTTETP
jgi:hypothetical protein